MELLKKFAKEFLEKLGIKYEEQFEAKDIKRFYITKCNEYMIDVSDFLICYVNRSFGGARHTLDYAKRKKHIKQRKRKSSGECYCYAYL